MSARRIPELWCYAFAWIMIVLRIAGMFAHMSEAWRADTIGCACAFLLLAIYERLRRHAA